MLDNIQLVRGLSPYGHMRQGRHLYTTEAEQDGPCLRVLTLSSPSSLYTVHPAFNDTTDDKDKAIDGKPLAKMMADLRAARQRSANFRSHDFSSVER
jgi:hypothetical protein